MPDIRPDILPDIPDILARRHFRLAGHSDPLPVGEGPDVRMGCPDILKVAGGPSVGTVFICILPTTSNPEPVYLRVGCRASYDMAVAPSRKILTSPRGGKGGQAIDMRTVLPIQYFGRELDLGGSR